MEKNIHKENWMKQDIRSMTSEFINYIDSHYYKRYNYESDKFEKINNQLFILITILSFLVTITVGLNSILNNYLNENFKLALTIITFIIPSISSVLLLYLNQKGFKKKEELREEARIESKFLINKAKAKFVTAKNDNDYHNIYNWLNEEIKILQTQQSKNYFMVHNISDKMVRNQDNN